MNRRELLKRVAAVAGMAALAPSVGNGTALASDQNVMPTLMPGQFWVLNTEIEDARAEGYLRGLDVGRASVESHQEYGETVWIRRPGVAQPTGNTSLTVSDSLTVTGATTFSRNCEDASTAPETVALYEVHDGHGVRYYVDGQDVTPSPTFEAMQADCAARGCYFAQGADGWSFHHAPTPPRIENGWTIHDVLHQVYIAAAGARTLMVVDDWRRSLHDPT